MLVLAGLVVGVVVLIGLLGGDEDDPPRRGPPARIVAVPALGLAFSHPTRWDREVDGKAIRLRSPDGSVIMTFASPVGGNEPAQVKAALERELRRNLDGARVVGDAPGTLGAREVATFEISGRAGDNPVRALAIVEGTEFRTYAITVITPAQPSRARLREVQAILGTVRLTEPVASPRADP